MAMWTMWSLLLASLGCTVVAAASSSGTFQAPSPLEKPRFRYWIPDASVDPASVVSDIKSAGRVGAGGVEVLGYYGYGGNLGRSPPGIDWTTTGWGLPAWKRVQDAAIEAAYSSDMIIDLALGPNQGAGVPANLSDPGRIWQLVSSNITVSAGQTFNGVLPGWGRGNFVAATTGFVLNNVSSVLTSGTLTGRIQVNGYRVTLSTASLTDVTSQVQADGRANLRFPATDLSGTYILFAFYQNQPLNYEQPPFSDKPVTNALQNGSWVVDHFSAAGAQTVIGFWQQNLLDADNLAKLSKVGNYLWEDSQEYTGESSGLTVLWTPGLISNFATSRGYSLQRYLPLILYNNNGLNGAITSTDYFVTDEADAGQRYVSDYRQSLTELNRDYLSTLGNWAQSLGLQFSAQPGYNLQLDMLSTIPYVAAPETESLGFNDNLDWYRQFVGPANLAQKKIISSELGAALSEVYAQYIPEILWSIKRSFVSSINAFVIHGFSYSGTYPTCTWPSFTTFIYLFSEMHGPHLPAWDYYNEWLGYTARNSHVLQNSVPKYDIAFWLKNTSYVELNVRYSPNDLESIGYTYQYISPDNFVLPAAIVKNQIFAPDAQAFKALVVRANDTLTAPGVQKLAQFAQAGLPIFFSGGLPSRQLGNDPAGQTYINSTINAIASLPNVHTVPYENLAVSLNRYGIIPRTLINMNGTVRTHWSRNSTDYVFIFNDASVTALGQGIVSGNITFETAGNPYFYNAWSGEIAVIESFSRNAAGSSVTVPISLAGNQTMIIGFNNTGVQKRPAIVSANSVVSITSQRSGQYLVKVVNSAAPSLRLTSGGDLALPPVSASAFQLTNWTLILESWSAPTNLTDSATPSVRTNTTYTLARLVSWDEVTNNNTAGRGFYKTSFTWPPVNSTSNVTGAILDFGYIRHTARLWINGIRTPPLDVTRAQVDIGPYLKNGINSVHVIVTSPLSNAVVPVRSQVACLIPQGNNTQIRNTVNGLTRDAVLIPYASVLVTL